MVGTCLRLIVAILLFPYALGAVELKVECLNPGSWTINTVQLASGDIEEFEVSLSSPIESTPPCFQVLFAVPQLDVHYRWTSKMEKASIPPDWSSSFESRLCSQMPLVAFVNDNDRNRICVAVNEAVRKVRFESGVREENCCLSWKIVFFSEPEAPLSKYSVRIRIDRRDVFFGDAISDGSAWIVRAGGLRPIPSPKTAFEPLYSTWYAFHQNISDRDIEEELDEAARLGMKVVIVDDGWQTDDNNRGYAYTGDWEISKHRFPDMASHVKKVHALGMKYMLWYGVPMVGFRSKNYQRFKAKTLWTHEKSGYACLDPRFSEVREFIVNLYEKALREWDIDGLKLDFIDNFCFHGIDPALNDNYAGRDIMSLPDAVDKLMKEVSERLRAIKSDVLIEFRQSYIGPAIRQYGNMLRATDCPGDLLSNRMRTANLRLTSGETAVHSDMLVWHREERPEFAARQILSVLFSTIQYSVLLRTCSESNKRMISHWLRFSIEHQKVLLHAGFRPHHCEANYTWIEAFDSCEHIAVVYVPDTVVPVSAKMSADYIINGTGTDSIVVDMAEAAKADIFDTFGDSIGSVDLVVGLNRVKLPISGYIVVRSPQPKGMQTP